MSTGNYSQIKILLKDDAFDLDEGCELTNNFLNQYINAKDVRIHIGDNWFGSLKIHIILEIQAIIVVSSSRLTMQDFPRNG